MYDLINFRVVRVGTDEVELASEGKQPFTLVVLARSKGVVFNVEEGLDGTPLEAVKKYADAIAAFDRSRELHLYDLERELPVLHLATDAAIPAFEPVLVRLVNDALSVAEGYGVELRMPERITEEDAETSIFLGGLLRGEFLGFETVTVTIVKDGSEEAWISGVLQGTGNAGCRLANEGVTRYFGGIAINTGPFDVYVDQLRCDDPQATLAEYRASPPGAVSTISCAAVTKPRAQRRMAT